MMKKLLLFALLLSSSQLFAQQPNLSVEWIMRDAKWIGPQPSSIRWSPGSKNILFRWNPEQTDSDSLYSVAAAGGEPHKLSRTERLSFQAEGVGKYSPDRKLMAYEKHGDIFLMEMGLGHIQRLTQSVAKERLQGFSDDGLHLIFKRGSNLYAIFLSSRLESQLTDFRKGDAPLEEAEKKKGNKAYLEKEELNLIGILKNRKEKIERSKTARKLEKTSSPKKIWYGSKSLEGVVASPNMRFVTYRLHKNASRANRTKVPNYVTESTYTEELLARPKVGSPLDSYESFVYDIGRDTTYAIKTDSISGIQKWPDFFAEYDTLTRDKARKTIIFGPVWSKDSRHAVVVIRSMDFKDRWIMELMPETGKLKLLDHQHDEAWIGGPGIVRWLYTTGSVGFMPGNKRFWYQSEKSGYSHLWHVDLATGQKKQLTKGKFEISNPKISKDKEHWFFTSNEVHPGEKHFYQMPINGGKRLRLTFREGSNLVSLSPDERFLAIRHSSANQPWDLYIKGIDSKENPRRITHSPSKEFLSYPWRQPEHVTFKARDGAKVHARLYRPENPSEKAVIFVHGAGYLQNAHKWWSNYFREYMFHNLLVDRGYTVLDMDYRASAGYGRDWRTAVYRDMGGKDLDDNVDGAKWLSKNYDIDPKKIGIYGGSYGGFITFMALFNSPETFACGAALRPVSDWAHYNWQYTASMLNLPQDDSIAYHRSSPIYHAEGLQKPLLICHGMVDTNVHFQDVVRLAQRFIELGKDDWEVAMFPMESHGFKEASSWTDEYKRVLKLFEDNLE